MLGRVGRHVRRAGGRGDQDDADAGNDAPRLTDQRAHAPFCQVRVDYQERRAVQPEQLHGGGEAFRLAVHPEMVEAQKPSQKDARLFVAGNDDGARRGSNVAAHGRQARMDPVCTNPDWFGRTTNAYFCVRLESPVQSANAGSRWTRQPGPGSLVPQSATPAAWSRWSSASW